MTARKLTTRQGQVLEILRTRARAGQACPTLREIGEELARVAGRPKPFQANAARDWLKALERGGHVQLPYDRTSRSIKLVEPVVMPIVVFEASLAAALGREPGPLQELLAEVGQLRSAVQSSSSSSSGAGAGAGAG